MVEALTQAAQDPEMWKYALRDLPELKQAVCDYYERRFGVSGITPSMVQSCNGTQEGGATWARRCSTRAIRSRCPDPCYPVFEAGAKIADAKLEYYPLVAEHNYLPYVAGIDPEVADRAKYMIVSAAREPGGFRWARPRSTRRSSLSPASTTCSSSMTTRTRHRSTASRAAASAVSRRARGGR